MKKYFELTFKNIIYKKSKQAFQKVNNIFIISLYSATQLWRRKFANIAKDYKDIKFAIANEEDYMVSLMKEFGLDESGEEFNVGCYMKGRKYK